MANFTQMTIISPTLGKDPLRKSGVAIILNKSLKCSTWVPQGNDRIASVHIQGKSFNITVIQVYIPTTNAEEVEVQLCYEDLQDLLELTKKVVIFITGDWKAKVRS